MTGEGTEGKTRAHINKINCYVKFNSETDSLYIYEQIHMSEKFPNNHPYIPDKPIDKSKLIKVWDIYKCLKKIEYYN